MRQKRAGYMPPVRYWRWLWVAWAVKVFVAFPAVVILTIPHALALGVEALVEWTGAHLETFYVRCHNVDRRVAIKNGWQFEPYASRTAPKLSEEWAKQAKGENN